MRTLIGVLCLTSSIAFAQTDGGTAAAKPVEPPPPADEINRVLDYYYNGKARGPALTALKACLKVDQDKNSATKFDCIEPVTGPVKKGTLVHLWTTFFVPIDGNYDDVKVQFLHGAEIRSTIDLRLDKSMRSRTWRSQGMTKTGKWTLRVMQGEKELGSTTVNVVD